MRREDVKRKVLLSLDAVERGVNSLCDETSGPITRVQVLDILAQERTFVKSSPHWDTWGNGLKSRAAPQRDAAPLSEEGEPVAWLVRRSRGGVETVVVAEDYKTHAAARADALGLTAKYGADVLPVPLYTHPAADRGVTGLGLHTRVEITYEVDQYRAQLVHEDERTLGDAVGDSPFSALAALAARDAQ